MSDISFQKAAYAQACLARGISNPNPAVGAVIVKNNKIISRGHTSVYGAAHAEVAAVKNAANSKHLQNATMYVTLTPCCFTGKTPPCTDIIIKNKIKKVVIANKDNNPAVYRKSEKYLRRAGVTVSYSFNKEIKKKCFLLNEDFFYKNKYKLPFIIAKYAMTLDGKIATYNGDSKWISSVAARRKTHSLRLHYDAIMAGTNTLLKDNPLLNIRYIRHKRSPLRIIPDASNKLPPDAKVFTSREPSLFLVNQNPSPAYLEQIKKNNKQYMKFSTRNNFFNFKTVFKKLATAYNINSIFVEGGSRIFGTLFTANLINKYYIFIAPRILGDGKNAVSPITVSKKIKSIKAALVLQNTAVQTIGTDLLIEGYVDFKTIANLQKYIA